MTAERSCRVCGCTEHNACMTEHGPCHWVAPDLCSACAADEFDPNGIYTLPTPFQPYEEDRA